MDSLRSPLTPDVRPRPINVLVLQRSRAHGLLPVASTSARRSTPSAALGPRSASSSACRGVVPSRDPVSFPRPRRLRHPVSQLSPSSSLPPLWHFFNSIGPSCPPFSGSAAWRSLRAPQGSSSRHVGAFGLWRLRLHTSRVSLHLFTRRHDPERPRAERRQAHASGPLLARPHTDRGLTPACSGLASLRAARH